MTDSESQIVKQDSKRYFMITKPQRVTRAMHSLEGLLKGIAIDNEITLDEVTIIQNWLEENQAVLQRDPFIELKSLIDNTLADGFIDENEKKDILWFCDKFTSKDNYFSAITSNLQRLHGILGGIISDNIIEKNELDGLKNWLDDHHELKSCWPFDDIDNFVSAVLEDGKIDEQEHEALLSFFGEFFNFSSQFQNEGQTDKKLGVISGICTSNPEIIFETHSFCLTGSSKRETRENIESNINNLSGIFSETLDKDVDYLVIGADGSPCWTYACYGRKVEQAIELQMKGSKIQIIHENDFWEAMNK